MYLLNYDLVRSERLERERRASNARLYRSLRKRTRRTWRGRSLKNTSDTSGAPNPFPVAKAA